MHWGKGLIITISLGILLEGCSGAPVREEKAAYPSPQIDLRAVVTDLASGSGASDGAGVCPIEWEEEDSPQAHRRIPERDELWEHTPSGNRVRLSLPPRIAARAKSTRTLETSDLWERIRNGMGLPQLDRAEIASELEWFSLKHYFDVVADRARPYLHHIVEEVERRDMPLEIALLPIIESAFQPTAYSPAGAVGIWQLISGTGSRFGLKQSAWYDGRRDVMAATQAALNYLDTLHERFDGDWLLALAAYNCGEGAVENAIERNRRLGRSTDFWSLDLPQETEKFVPKLLAVSSIVADPSEYQLTLDPIPNKPYLKEVYTGGQISLDKAAALVNMSVAKLRSLNPGLTGSTTDPTGPHKLVLPIDKARKFQRRWARLPVEQRLVSLSPDRVAEKKALLAAPRRSTHAGIRKISGNTVAKRKSHKPSRKVVLRSSGNPGKLTRRAVKKSGLSMRKRWRVGIEQKRERDS
jgi:hypothetical protein